METWTGYYPPGVTSKMLFKEKESDEAYMDNYEGKEKERPGFYFIWGEEPEGYVSTGVMDEYDNVNLTGIMTLEEATERGYKKHNPYTSTEFPN